MKYILLSILVCAVAIGQQSALKDAAQTLGEKSKAPAPHGLRKGTLANDAFKAGLLMGFTIRAHGGTTNDINYIYECFSSNRIDLARQWLEERK